MKTVMILLISAGVLSGCALDPKMFQSDPEIKVVTVEKPILYCPAPPDLEQIRYIIEDLVPGDEKDPGKVAQYYRAGIKQLEGEIKKRDIILDAYRKMQNKGLTFTPLDADMLMKESIKNEIKTTDK